jgi:Glycosyltransferase family 17
VGLGIGLVVGQAVIIDTLMFHDEFEMLDCRLAEIGHVVDAMVVVEADVDHQNNPKPYHLTQNLDRFDAWESKLVIVRASGLSTGPSAWEREHAQREWIMTGLEQVGATGDDIILQSDVDEIPRALQVRNVRPRPGQVITFQQRFHPFAVDWIHPEPWPGTVAARLDTVLGLHPTEPFTWFRDTRFRGVVPPGYQDAGWHFSWVGQDPIVKSKRFCHLEILERVEGQADRFLDEGYHVDGRKLQPVDVDSGWPVWIRDGNAPQSWYRPR